MKKKIFWHYPHLYLWMGGARFIPDLCQHLTKDYEINLGCAGGLQDLIAYYNSKDIKVIKTGFISTNSIIYWIFSPLLIVTEVIFTYAKTKGSEILIGTAFPSLLIIAICAKLQRKKYIHHCYVPYPWFYDKEFINQYPRPYKVAFKIIQLLYKPLDQWAAKNASETITLDTFNANYIKKVYKITPKEISLGIDTSFFKPVPTKQNKIIKKYKTQKIIFHCTDYTKLKNTQDVIKIFAKFTKRNKNVILLISTTRPGVTEESEHQELARKLSVEEKIVFLGAVNYNLLPDYYSAAWCYISLSHHPMAAANLPVKEALACGTPAIRNHVTYEDVQNNISGFLVDYKNHAEILDKLTYLLKPLQKRNIMGDNGRKHIMKLYSWPAVSQKFTRYINLKT